MAKVCILGNWHAGSNAAQYAKAFRLEGHEVTTVGPRFTDVDAERWYESLREMEWAPSTAEANAYITKVLAESPTPDIKTEKGETITPSDDYDLIVRFDAHGESPVLGGPGWAWRGGAGLGKAGQGRGSAPVVGIFSDTHTGALLSQVENARGFDCIFVQFRRGDMQAFKEAGIERVHWLPAAADPSVWRHVPDMEKDIDCLFVGSTHPQVHKERVELLHFLKRELGDDRVVVKHAFGTDAALLMNRARVVLNRSLAGDLNMRVPEALCTGAMLVTDAVDGLESFGGQYWRYRTPEEALEQINKALQHLPNEEARRNILNEHTYRYRAQWLLSTVGLDKTGMAGPGTAGLGRARRGWARHGLARQGETTSVSIIVPCFNHWQDQTEPLLMSGTLGAQDAEVLVVDDGSIDKTKDARLAHPYRILHKPNGGFASAVNYGAAHATGEYLVVLNNDCRPEPGWLESLLAQLDAGAGVVGALILNPNGTTNSAGLEQRADGTWWNKTDGSDTPREEIAVTGACFAIRRDLFWLAGGLDSGFGSGGADDVDFALRVRKLLD